MTLSQVLRFGNPLVLLTVLAAALTGCPAVFHSDEAGTVSFTASPDSGVAPLAVGFEASANLYPSYDVVSWAWDFGDGATGTGQQTSHTYVVAGAYSVVLQVCVSAEKFRGQEDQAPTVIKCSRVVTVQAGVTNNPPVADAGPDQASFPGTAVALDGSGSSDPDGDTVTYVWSFASVPAGSAAALVSATTVHPSFTADLVGNYVIQLIVNDGMADSAPDTMTVAVTNRTPTASAGTDQTTFVGTAVTLDGSGSSDPDGDPLTYAWSVVAQPSVEVPTKGNVASLLEGETTANPVFTPYLKGGYVIQLIVSDGKVSSTADTVMVTVTNRAPVADAGADQTAYLGIPVLLDGSGSSDPDDDGLTYAWSVVSQPAADKAIAPTLLTGETTVSPTLTPARKGVYVIQLIVNDGTADSSADTVTVTVANRAPVANAGTDQASYTGTVVALDGSGSTDADGDWLAYAWSFASVPTGSAAALSGAASVAPSFTPDLRGEYVIQLIVNDGTADSPPDTVTVTVANRAPTAVGAVLPSGEAEGDVYDDAENPALTANNDVLYGILSYSNQGTKQYGTQYYLYRLDPSDASTIGQIPLTMIVDEGTYLQPVIIHAGKGLAVDPSTGDLWAVLGFARADDLSTTYYTLAKINPHSGVVTPVGDPLTSPLSDALTGLAIDDNGTPYAVTLNTDHSLYTVSATDNSETFVAALTALSTTGERDDSNVIAFNTDDELIYHIASVEYVASRLAETVDLDWTLTSIGMPVETWYNHGCTALTHAPGTNTFYAAYGYEGCVLYRLSLESGSFTETYVGYPSMYNYLYGLAFLYDRTLPPPVVTLDASGSDDPEGDTLIYSWHFTSVPAGSTITDADLSDTTSATPSFTPDVRGTYALQVVVNDGELSSDPATVTVNYVNAPPIANAGNTQSISAIGGFVQLNGGDSYDPDGDTLTYAWTVVSVPAGSSIVTGSIVDGSTATPYFYPDVVSSTPYVFQLVVTDADNAPDTATVEIYTALN